MWVLVCASETMTEVMCLRGLFGFSCVYLIFEKHWSYIQLGNVDFVIDLKKVVEYFHRGIRDITKFETINNCKNYCS